MLNANNSINQTQTLEAKSNNNSYEASFDDKTNDETLSKISELDESNVNVTEQITSTVKTKLFEIDKKIELENKTLDFNKLENHVYDDFNDSPHNHVSDPNMNVYKGIKRELSQKIKTTFVGILVGAKLGLYNLL